MLQVTPRAREHLAKVRRERTQGEASARFVPSISGAGVSLTFASQPNLGDHVVHADGIDVFIDRAVADRLDRSVIDVGKGKSGSTALILKAQPNPNPVTG